MITFNDNLIGKMKIRQDGDVFDIEIRDGNCLAVLVFDAGSSYCLYNFFVDKKHLSNIWRAEGNIISDEVLECSLNYRYDKAVKELLYYLTLQGVRPLVYFE